MSGDQQFILALIGIIGSLVLQVLTLRKASDTHDIVNGQSVAKTAAAVASGVAIEHAAGMARAADLVANPLPSAGLDTSKRPPPV